MTSFQHNILNSDRLDSSVVTWFVSIRVPICITLPIAATKMQKNNSNTSLGHGKTFYQVS